MKKLIVLTLALLAAVPMALEATVRFRPRDTGTTQTIGHTQPESDVITGKININDLTEDGWSALWNQRVKESERNAIRKAYRGPAGGIWGVSDLDKYKWWLRQAWLKYLQKMQAQQATSAGIQQAPTVIPMPRY